MSEADFSYYTQITSEVLRIFRWLCLIPGILVFVDLKKLKQGFRSWIPSMVMGAFSGMGCFCLSYLTNFGLQQMVSDHILSTFDFMQPGDLERFLFQSFVVWFIFCISDIVLTLLMLFLLHRIVKLRFPQTIYEAVYLSVLNGIAYVLSRFFSQLSVVPLERDVFVLTDRFKMSPWIFLLISVLLFLGEAFLVATWQKNRVMKEKEEQLLFASYQTEALKKRLSDTETEQRKLAGFRHDLKNHLANLHGLLEGEAYQEADRYLKSMDDIVCETEPRFLTGSALLDVILNDKAAEAEQDHVSFAASVDGDHTPDYILFDLGVLLTNLIDNAIQAASEKRTEYPSVFVSLKKKGYFLIFKVQNTYAGELRIDPDTSRPMPVGKQKPGHGLGVKNAMEICEKHLGTLEYCRDGNAVVARGMIQIKENEYYESNNEYGE